MTERRVSPVHPTRPTGPTPPNPAFLNRMDAIVDEQIGAAAPEFAVEPGYPEREAVWAGVEKRVSIARADLEHIMRDLHANPEEAFKEFHAQQVIAEVLETHGFEVIRGAHGVDTALRAQWQSDDFDPAVHPTVAVMSEYDALPGIGHACGHNVIAASGVGGFLGAVGSGSGRIVFLGTPAEEGHTGKECMIWGGMLEGVDCAVMIHPFSYDLVSHAWTGRRSLTATFSGVAAHASMQPYMGRNALDAATLAYQAFGLLRQQMPPSDRLHAIIADGGARASIIPEEATLNIYVRSLYTDTLMDLSKRIDDILTGAALMTGTGVEVDWDNHPMSLPVRNNETLAARWGATQQARGRRVLPGGILPDSQAASTDFGNVSQLVPGIHPLLKIAPEGTALHTVAFADAAITPAAIDGVVDSAVGLGQVIADVLNDPQLLADARAEFDAAGGAVSVEALLSEAEDATGQA